MRLVNSPGREFKRQLLNITNGGRARMRPQICIARTIPRRRVTTTRAEIWTLFYVNAAPRTLADGIGTPVMG
ncbi:unnamed protein product, partial [Iphiclides podalirius]